MRISVNTTPGFSEMLLTIKGPNTLCEALPSIDSYSTCLVDNPAAGPWSVTLSGSLPLEWQVVGSVTQ
jgi:hypothetical protein